MEKIETAGTLASVPRLSLPANVGDALPGVMSRRERIKNELVVAGLRGRVVAVTARGSVVIEGQAAVVSGALGAGKQIAGPLTIWQTPGRAQGQPYIPPGAILVVPGPLNLAMLRQALNSGIAGIVASSISSRDFEYFLHTNLIDLLNCANVDLILSHLPPLTVLLTEGLGTAAMPLRTLDLLSKYQGMTALLSGSTSIRARRYPELVISLPNADAKQGGHSTMPDMELKRGALVRV
jgi:hypothetical protein